MAIQQEREEDSAAEVGTPSSKLKLVAHYAVLGVGPLVAIVALVVAVLALGGNRSGEEQIGKLAAKTNGMDESLAAAKNELERLKLAMAQEKNRQEDERQRQKELEDKIILNISQLQSKAKITPTLEQQLQSPASAPASAPAATGAAAPATTSPAAGERKPGSQAQAIKEAIEKFNKQ